MKIGDTFYISKAPLKVNKAHVVGVVDGDWIVFKWYGKVKQWWHYEIKHRCEIDMLKSIAERIKQSKKKSSNNQ